MILYWAWPTDGAGHAVRAASICRHLKNEVLVIRGIDDPRVNKALDHFDVPYTVISDRHHALKFVKDQSAKTVVVDDAGGTQLDRLGSIYLWRMGRPANTARPMPKIRFEGPGAVGPILMLEDSEILSKEEAREALGLPQDKFLRIAIPSTSRPGLVESQPNDYVLTEWPALKYMRAADHIVGCIGVNLYGEVQYLGLPASWVKAPHAKDQAVRIFDMPQWTPVPDAAKRIAERIDILHG